MTTAATSTVPGTLVNNKTDPSTDSARIAWAFLNQYYQYLNKDPGRLHCFYTKRSTLIHSTEGEDASVCHGQQEIHSKIMSLNLTNSKIFVSNVDSQSSAEGGIIVQVVGEITKQLGPWQKFVQTFFLAEQPNGYFVLNDICRILKDAVDDLQSDGSIPIDTDAASTKQNMYEAQNVHCKVGTEDIVPPNRQEPNVNGQVNEPASAEVQASLSSQPLSIGAGPLSESAANSLQIPLVTTDSGAPPILEANAEPTPASTANLSFQYSSAEEDGKVNDIGADEQSTPAVLGGVSVSTDHVDQHSPLLSSGPKEAATSLKAVGSTSPISGAASPAPTVKSWASLAASNTTKWDSQVLQKKGGPSGTRSANSVPVSIQKGASSSIPFSNALDAIQAMTFPSCFVKGVLETVTERALRELLSGKFGPIKDMDVVRSRSCAFVTFERIESARRAIQASLKASENGQAGILVPSNKGDDMVLVQILPRKSTNEKNGSVKTQDDGAERVEQRTGDRQVRHNISESTVTQAGRASAEFTASNARSAKSGKVKAATSRNGVR